MVRVAQHHPERSAILTDEAQLVYECQRLHDAQAKLARAHDESTRYYYQCAVAGWARSIAVLEREIKKQQCGHN